MMNKMKIKLFKILILIIGILYIGYVASQSMVWAGLKTRFVDATKELDIKEGDFVFQHLPGELLSVIADVTESQYSHCGIIVKKDGQFYVLEAIGPVKFTPLNQWIHRGISSKITIVRLKEQYQSQVPKIIKSSYQYLNRPYDIQYEWDDEKIYCSELIYKSVREATGLKLAEFRKLKSMNWRPHESYIRSITGGELPLDRMMITPEDLVQSDKVSIVYSSFDKQNVNNDMKKIEEVVQ